MTDTEKNLAFGNIKTRTTGETPYFSPEEASPWPRVDECYVGFYRIFRPEKGSDDVLAGASCVIGSEMRVVLEGEPHLETEKQEHIASLTLADGDLLRRCAERGWTVRCFINYVVYSNSTCSLWAEFAFFAFDPAYAPLGVFVKETVNRIKHGEHPGLSLTQRQADHVFESKGAWYLTKATPLPERKKGEVVFKRKRGAVDSMVGLANQNKIGCELFAIVFWLAVIALVVWLVFF